MDKEKTLVYLVYSSKKGNKKSLLTIIDQFTPLIHKYSRKLNYEDAKSELIEKLLTIVLQMPKIENEKKIISYIHKSIIHEYIKLSKRNTSFNQRLTFYDDSFFECTKAQNEFSKIHFFELINDLKPRQQVIIKYKYYYGYTTNEIASKLNITRQSVYKNEKCALNILKNQISPSQKF